MTDTMTRPDTTQTADTETTPADATRAGDGIDFEALQAELDAIRDDIIADLGSDDADYIRKMIRLQRRLDAAGRLVLMAGVFPPAWLAGVALLGTAKILENMEIGHNVMHGQWDWMRDPEIHSTTWEWDNVCPSSQWKHSHNYLHHHFTNVRGKDHDIGYGVLRVDPEAKWYRWNLAQPLIFTALGSLFQWGVGLHDLAEDWVIGEKPDLEKMRPKLSEIGRKALRQLTKDYVGFPLLALPLGVPSAAAVLTGNAAANLIRNVWSFAVIFCGHFPDGVELFDEETLDGETRGEWYYRQIRGSANFTGGPLMDVMSGNLNHQVEHHLYPDMPSNRYAEAAPRVREVCARHGITYNSGGFGRQFGTVVRKVMRLTFK